MFEILFIILFVFADFKFEGPIVPFGHSHCRKLQKQLHVRDVGQEPG